MAPEPDFYMYGGDGNREVLDTIRSCFRLESGISAVRREVIIVRIEPLARALPKGARKDLIGLSNRSRSNSVDGVWPDGVCAAIVHEVYEEENGCYRTLPNIGKTMLFKERPQLKPDGTLIWPPASIFAMG